MSTTAKKILICVLVALTFASFVDTLHLMGEGTNTANSAYGQFILSSIISADFNLHPVLAFPLSLLLFLFWTPQIAGIATFSGSALVLWRNSLLPQKLIPYLGRYHFKATLAAVPQLFAYGVARILGPPSSLLRTVVRYTFYLLLIGGGVKVVLDLHEAQQAGIIRHADGLTVLLIILTLFSIFIIWFIRAFGFSFFSHRFKIATLMTVPVSVFLYFVNDLPLTPNFFRNFFSTDFPIGRQLAGFFIVCLMLNGLAFLSLLFGLFEPPDTYEPSERIPLRGEGLISAQEAYARLQELFVAAHNKIRSGPQTGPVLGPH